MEVSQFTYFQQVGGIDLSPVSVELTYGLERLTLCGYVGVINDCCPRCGRKEGEGVSAELLDELRKKYPHIPQWS